MNINIKPYKNMHLIPRYWCLSTLLGRLGSPLDASQVPMCFVEARPLLRSWIWCGYGWRIFINMGPINMGYIFYDITGWFVVFKHEFYVSHILGIGTPTDELIFFLGVGIPLTRLDITGDLCFWRCFLNGIWNIQGEIDRLWEEHWKNIWIFFLCCVRTRMCLECQPTG